MIKNKWREVSDEYLKLFCEALGFDYDSDAYWIGDDPGTIAQIGDFFVGINEMRFFVDNAVDPELFFKWYDYSLDIHELQADYNQFEGYTQLTDISFESFVKGAPKPYSYTQIKKMQESLSAIRKSTEAFKEQFKELSGM